MNFADMPISRSASTSRRLPISPGRFRSIRIKIYSYRLRGRAYYFLSQFDNAMADYEAALRIDANDSTTISYINDLRRRRGGR